MGGGGQEAKEGVAAPFPRHKQAPTPGPHVLDPLSGAVPALRGTRGEGAAGATVAGRGCKDTLATEGLLEPAAPRGPRRSAPRMGGCCGGRVGHPHALTLAPRGPCGGGAALFPSEFRAPAGPGGRRGVSPLVTAHMMQGSAVRPGTARPGPANPPIRGRPAPWLHSRVCVPQQVWGEHGCGAQTTDAALE